VARDYQALCAEVVHRFEGHIEQDQGDWLVVYFGYPQAHEDDARRAVHTGLGLVEGTAELNRRLPRARGVRLAVRVGIHTGVVVVGAMGKDEHTLLTLGDAPAIAVQVQGLAAPDMVVISPTTLRLVERYFESRALGAYILEDPTEPVAVYQILQEWATQSQFEVMVTKGLTPLVGREQEMGLLRERWAQVKDGWGQVVLLSGEAGIGKSRLVQALKEHLTVEVHTRIGCYALSYYQQSAFYPIVEHIQQLLQFHKDDTPEEKLCKLEVVLGSYNFALEEVVPLFAVLLSLPLADRYAPLALTPERQKQKILEALLTWLLREAERQPVCLITEDLHWVDPSTLEWLSLLMDQIPTTRVLMLLTFRPDFQPPWAARSYLTHLTLGRLSPRQTEGMIGQVVGGRALPAEVMQQVVATTDGVPLFVEELTKMVVELGLVKEREGRYELTGPLPSLTIPATLHDSLMTRLDRLGAAKQVAQLGAVVGREFAYEVLQAIVPMEEAVLQQGLAQLVDAELLYQRGLPPQARYLFKHALIQEAAYQSLLRSTRRQYHRQIAQVLEEQFPETCELHPELVAHHYTEAGCSTQALPYWQRAGRRAIERSANLEAISHLTKGLELLKMLPDTPERAQDELDVHIALGIPLVLTRGHAAPEVEVTYARACELCRQLGDTPQVFSALLGLMRFYFHRGKLTTAHDLGEQLLHLAERLGDAGLLVRAHHMLAENLVWVGEFVGARVHAEQGIARYIPQQHRALMFHYGTDSGVGCRTSASMALWVLGYPDQARQWSDKALALAQALAHPFSLGLALYSAAYLYQLRREGALTHTQAEAVIALATEQGFPIWMALGPILRGWALAEQGQVGAGLAQIRQGLAAWQATGARIRPSSLTLLAGVYGQAGQPEEGLHVLAEAQAAAQATGERFWEAELVRRKGELLLMLATKHQAEAETCFHQAIEIAHRQEAKSWELRAAMNLSRLWQQQGKRAAAQQLLGEIYGWFTEGFGTADLQEAKALLETLS
jgi:predicted ATPase